jgi:hypothetical protein
MRIYFTGSLHNHDIDKRTYQEMVEVLTRLGHKVKAPVVSLTKERLDTQTPEERSAYYSKLKKTIAGVDVVVGEISYPSTINIGHEITLAMDMGKPVVALYQKGREPGVLLGIASERFIILEYELGEMADVVSYGMEEAEASIDVRFNFFISPKIANYLDSISKKKKLPRAVYLRRLIEEDMKNNEEYNS